MAQNLLMMYSIATHGAEQESHPHFYSKHTKQHCTYDSTLKDEDKATKIQQATM